MVTVTSLVAATVEAHDLAHHTLSPRPHNWYGKGLTMSDWHLNLVVGFIIQS